MSSVTYRRSARSASGRTPSPDDIASRLCTLGRQARMPLVAAGYRRALGQRRKARRLSGTEIIQELGSSVTTHAGSRNSGISWYSIDKNLPWAFGRLTKSNMRSRFAPRQPCKNASKISSAVTRLANVAGSSCA